MLKLSLKAISALRANTEAGLSHMEALVGVKSVSDFVELQTSFFRKQAELFTAQAKDLQDASDQGCRKGRRSRSRLPLKRLFPNLRLPN